MAKAAKVEPLKQRDAWAIAELRALIDAHVAVAYGLSAVQYTAVLSTFPNLDRTQAMLSGEPKSFVTRDLALSAFLRATGVEAAPISELLERAGDVFENPRRKDEPPVDLKALHAKIGQLALENDFLEGALGKAGMLSAKK